jgi:hypothetical protein
MCEQPIVSLDFFGKSEYISCIFAALLDILKRNKSKRCKKVKKKPHQKKVKEKKEINKKFRSACILCVLWLIVSLLT